MHLKYRRLSDAASLLGFAASVVACWLLIYRDGWGVLAWPLLVLGTISMFIGLCFYIRAKGYHPAWALLLFLIGPVVFFVFFFLPNCANQNTQKVNG